MFSSVPQLKSIIFLGLHSIIKQMENSSACAIAIWMYLGEVMKLELVSAVALTYSRAYLR